jgi:hypothetical protein
MLFQEYKTVLFYYIPVHAYLVVVALSLDKGWKWNYFKVESIDFFSVLYSTLLHLPPVRSTVSEDAVIRSIPVQLRFRHRLSDALNTRLDLIRGMEFC